MMELTNTKEVKKFLVEHPEIERALGLFGISHDLYLQLLLAQSRPIFYTSDSTNKPSD